jgi:hypothetical protein
VPNANLVPGHDQLGAEIGGETGCCALSAQGTSEHALEPAEATLELVAGRGQVRIIEAGEQVGPPAPRHRDQVVDEGGGRCAETDPRGRALQGGEEVPELGLRLGAVLGVVCALGVCGEVTGYVAEDLDVPLDPAGGAGPFPGEGQRLIEPVEPGRGQPLAPQVFFFSPGPRSFAPAPAVGGGPVGGVSRAPCR